MQFHEILKMRRLDVDMTQAELAKKANVTESSISYYESGDRAPTIKTAKKLAEALGITLNELFEIEEK
jgi:transcriptional regulator with XRE-family HTH domain